jgi:hypothetical protein
MDFTGGGTFGMNFNGDDFFFSFAGDFQDRHFNWGIEAGFDFRPFHNRVLIQDDATTFHQYLEKKYLFWLGVEKRFFLLHANGLKFGLFASANGGYIFGNYRGTKKNPVDGFTFIPKAGFAMDIDQQAIIRIGYEYLDPRTAEVSNHRIFVNITGLFN